MKRITILAALLVLLVTSAFAQRRPTLTDDDIETTKTTSPKGDEKGSSSSSGWIEISPTASGCKVLMPTRPTARTQMQDLPMLGQVEHHLLQATEGNNVYQLTYFQLPSSESVDINSAAFRQAFLSGVTKGLVKSLQGELISETAINHEGAEGREAQIKVPSGVVWSRVFLINGKIYSLSVFSANSNLEGQRRFFNSFSAK